MTNIALLLAVKNIKHLSTIRDGVGVTLVVKFAYVNQGQVFIQTEQGTVTFDESDVQHFELCMNNSVNVTVKGHREEYNLSW